MNKFFKKILVFIIPILLLFIGVEIYLRNSDNSFITKANYLKANYDKIEILVLGTSHSQNGINPKYFKKNTCNLSYGSQDIQIDSALFFSNCNKMKNLKTVLFELDYHRMDINREGNFYRLPWYYIYYDINLGNYNYLDKLSLYATNTNFFNSILLSDLTQNESEKLVINNFGFVEKNYTNEFKTFNYDEKVINALASERLKDRHKEISVKNFEKNKSRIISIIKYAKQNNINLIVVSSPLYKTYIENKISNKSKKVNLFINELINDYGVKYYNFENNPSFTIKDFSNEDHLNASGAKKYSKILDSIVNLK